MAAHPEDFPYRVRPYYNKTFPRYALRSHHALPPVAQHVPPPQPYPPAAPPLAAPHPRGPAVHLPPPQQHAARPARTAPRTDSSHHYRPRNDRHVAQPSRPLPFEAIQNIPGSPLSLEPVQLFLGSLSKDRFIEVTAHMLDLRATANNDFVALPTYSEPESVFFSVSKPEIPTKDYIRRLVTYTQCSPSAFVVMLIFADRISKRNSRLLVTPYNMHRLLVTALTLACKMLDDRCFSNVHYAKVGGIPTAREMNRLEIQFLKYVKFDLRVSVERYLEKLNALETQPAPRSPTSVTGAVFHTAASNSSPVSSMDRMDRSLGVKRGLSFENESQMVGPGPGVDVTADSRYPVPITSESVPTHFSVEQSKIIGEKPYHMSEISGPHSHTGPKRSARRDSKSGQVSRMQRDSRLSSVPVRYMSNCP